MSMDTFEDFTAKWFGLVADILPDVMGYLEAESSFDHFEEDSMERFDLEFLRGKLPKDFGPEECRVVLYHARFCVFQTFQYTYEDIDSAADDIAAIVYRKD